MTYLQSVFDCVTRVLMDSGAQSIYLPFVCLCLLGWIILLIRRLGNV